MEVLSLCLSWWGIIVGVKLVVYDVWFDEDDNTGFLSVGLNIFDWLYLKERPISLPVVPMSTINAKNGKSYFVRRTDKNQNIWNFWWIIEILCLGDPPLSKKLKNQKMTTNMFW